MNSQNEKPKLLDCFCGMGGVSDGFALEGFDITGIDIVDAPKMLGYKHKFIQADMLTLKGEDFQGYDVIWGSPPCKCFSVASIGKHWKGGWRKYEPADNETLEALRLVRRFYEFVVEANPTFWIMENPRGLLRKVIFPPIGTITLCQYGDTRMKPTDIWGKLPSSFIFKRCKNGDACHVRAPRGAKTGTQGLKNSWERAKIPLACSRAFAKACMSSRRKSEKMKAEISLKQKVICLVGSTKPQWRQRYREVLEKLTLMGNAVFTVVWFRGDFQGDFEARRELMEQVHYLKIKTSDAVVCISKDAIGEHTRMEMEYARSIGKPVFFAEDLK